MALRLSPVIKGFITAAVMIAATLLIDARRTELDPRWQYLVFIIYGAGIVWTLISFHRSGTVRGKFSAYFGQAFRCFIIVIIMMVAFTAIYLKVHPEYAAQEAQITREYYLKKGDKTPAELDDIAEKAKKQYPVTFISISIFGYLIIGAVVSAGISALLTRRQ